MTWLTRDVVMWRRCWTVRLSFGWAVTFGREWQPLGDWPPEG